MAERGVYASLTDDDVVTGEGVALDLPAASLGSRMVSGLIDVAVTVLLLIALVVVFALASVRTDAALAGAAIVTATVLVFVVFPTAVETLTRGRTLGKLAMGLRTVRDDAGPISFQHALIRSLVGFVEIYLLSGVPAVFAMLFNRRGKRLGDLAASTFVVRTRFPLRLPAPAQMPPPLAAWARAADVTALPVGLALAVRQVLGRAGDLTPQVRHAVATRLAEQVQPHVAPPPPPGTPPEAFLAAVVAVRRERDLARLGREDDLRRRLSGSV